MSKDIWRAGNMLYPLPAVMVGCQRPDEKPNIITVAWAGTICSSPAMVSISVRPERYSYDILKETGEFVINLTTEKLVRATDFCGVRSGRDVDKFEMTSLHREKASYVNAPLIKESPVSIECKVNNILELGRAQHVSAPLIEESPVNIECRTTQILELGSHHMFVAEVLGVDVDEQYLDEKGKFQLNKAGLMVYSHGEYFGLGRKLGTFGYSVRRKKTGK